jgi:hypothetical protein
MQGGDLRRLARLGAPGRPASPDALRLTRREDADTPPIQHDAQKDDR